MRRRRSLWIRYERPTRGTETPSSGSSGLREPTSLPSPGEDARQEPDRTSGEVPIRIREHSSGPPLVDGRTPDSEQVGDLGETDDVGTSTVRTGETTR